MPSIRHAGILSAALLSFAVGIVYVCRADPASEKKPDKLSALLAERAAIAKQALAASRVAYEAGTITLDQLLATSNELTRAELALCKTKDERIVVIEAHVKREKEMEGRIIALWKAAAKGGEPDKLSLAGLNRVNAEIDLEHEKQTLRRVRESASEVIAGRPAWSPSLILFMSRGSQMHMRFCLYALLISPVFYLAGFCAESANLVAGEIIKPDTPTLPDSVVKGWRNAGAEIGWMGSHDSYGLSGFRELSDANTVSARPAFRFRVWTSGMIGKLPRPFQRFGLALGRTKLSDSDIREISVLKDLQLLDISDTGVTGQTMSELSGLTSLESLDLSRTQVTDLELKQLARLKNLKELSISGTNVTDAGLKELAGLKNLQLLDLVRTGVTDAGMVNLADVNGLQVLCLAATHVSDFGVKNLNRLTDLRMLNLRNDKSFTDAGMKEAAKHTSLQALNVGGTLLTDEGVKELRTERGITSLFVAA